MTDHGWLFGRRSVALLALIGLVLAATLSIGVSVASAGSSDCPSGNWCTWIDINYSGTMGEYNNTNSGTNHWAALFEFSGTSSVYNHRQNTVWFAYEEDPNGIPPSGAKDCMIPGGGRGNLTNWSYPDGTNENDNVNFFDLIYSGTTCP